MGNPRRDPHHPMCVFRDKWGMNPREMGYLLGLDEQAVRCFEADTKITDEWIIEFCTDPMMSNAYLAKRVHDAMLKSYLDMGFSNEDAEAKIIKRTSVVRRWRKEKGLTQMQAAELLGVHWSTLSKYESNDRNVPFEILDKIEGELA